MLNLYLKCTYLKIDILAGSRLQGENIYIQKLGSLNYLMENKLLPKLKLRNF